MIPSGLGTEGKGLASNLAGPWCLRPSLKTGISPLPVTGFSCESVRPHTAWSLPPLRIVYQKE